VTVEKDAAWLLTQAAGYALESLVGISAHDLGRPTPCAGWDLNTLLGHVADSLDVLVDVRAVAFVSSTPHRALTADLSSDPITAVGRRIDDLIYTWNSPRDLDAVCEIGDRVLWTETAAAAGAVELAAHGWDIFSARDVDTPIPARLASELLDVCVGLITEDSRRPEFAPAVPIAASASPSERLVAFLGRARRS